jgi:hypothetical protein
MSMSICEKTTTLKCLDLELVTITLSTETCNILLVHLRRQSNTSPLYTRHWSHLLNCCLLYSLYLKFKLIYNQRSVGQSVFVSGSHLEHMTRFFCSFWRLQVSWCGAPSLTRGWVCNLLVQSLLNLARLVTLGSKSCRTHDHILLSHFRLPQLGGPGPRICISQERGGPVTPLGTGFPFVASYD